MKWEAKGSETSTATWVIDETGKRVCTMNAVETDWDNCRLIATTPELHTLARQLAAMDERTFAMFTHQDLINSVRALSMDARAAIARSRS